MKPAHITIATIAGLIASTPATMAQEQLAIGFPPSIDMLPAIVAHENGCLADAGYASSLTVIPIATNIPPALLSGSLQIGMSTPTILLPAVENGVDLVAVAGGTIMQAGNEGVSLITQPSLKITDPTQLKGLKVGVPGIMSVADLVFRKWLTQSGIDPNEVTFIEVPLPRMAEMMKSGTVDAVVAVQPVLGGLVAGGIAERNVGEFFSFAADGAIMAFWSASGEWAKSHPEAVAAFRTCLDASIPWIIENRAAANEMGAKYLNFSTEFTPFWRTEIVPADFDYYVTVSKEFGLVRSDVDTSKLVFAAE
jgi:NitT/TauT family transport system substrate-binding protein